MRTTSAPLALLMTLSMALLAVASHSKDHLARRHQQSWKVYFWSVSKIEPVSKISMTNMYTKNRTLDAMTIGRLSAATETMLVNQSPMSSVSVAMSQKLGSWLVVCPSAPIPVRIVLEAWPA